MICLLANQATPLVLPACSTQELRDAVVQRLAAIEAAVAGTAAAQAERFEGTKQLLEVGGWPCTSERTALPVLICLLHNNRSYASLPEACCCAETSPTAC